MPWFWFLLWLLLVLGAVAVLGLGVRRLYRQGKALTRELSVATDRLAQVTDALAALEQAAAEEVAQRSAHGTVTAGDGDGRHGRRDGSRRRSRARTGR